MDVINGKQLELRDAVHAYQLDNKGGIRPIQEDSLASTTEPFWLHLNYSEPLSLEWLKQTALIPEPIRDALAGESSRPRVAKLAEGTYITLRSINFNSDSVPDPLVTLRIYINGSMIISSRARQISATDQVSHDLQGNNGPINSGDWIVQIADSLTDHSNDFIDSLHDKIIELEDGVLEQEIPERGEMALIRKQLIILRRYLLPQRDVFSRLASERLSWMSDEDRHRMQDIAERLGRALDDLDASISRTTVLSDEINAIMAEATNRRTYTMSLLAMLFLPASFLTGLFGVNLRGMPGLESPMSFNIFCGLLVVIALSIVWWLRKSNWL